MHVEAQMHQHLLLAVSPGPCVQELAAELMLITCRCTKQTLVSQSRMRNVTHCAHHDMHGH